eukprot:c24812_g1_i1 orf=780-1208(-)
MDQQNLGPSPLPQTCTAHFESRGGHQNDIAGLVPVAKFWEVERVKKEKGFPWLRISDSVKRLQKQNLGPGGGLGVGCGAGVGVALVGGAGMGAGPWSSLRFVFGIGVGCGVGIGYGFGFGLGVLWDRPPQHATNGKRLVIQI